MGQVVFSRGNPTERDFDFIIPDVVDEVGKKWCPGCKTYKDRTTEHFNRNSAKGDGLQSLCKICHGAWRDKGGDKT